jgi:hypothetical protein
MGMEPIALGVEQSGAFIKAEINRWAQIVKISGAKVD